MNGHSTLGRLACSLDGDLLLPGESGYDEARTVWNAMIDKRPAVVIRARSAHDVCAAIALANAQGLAIAVRGGGHNVAGLAVCDGGLLIDLSAMRSVQVDPVARTARVAGGALLRDLDQACQAHGLVTPGGVVSSTGVAGLTLGGGFGWLARAHGLAADNLLAVELVTAAGQPVRASAGENPDLFWAVRGGGGNFGVVTQFEFGLHPLTHPVLFGPTMYRIADAPKVLRRYRDFCGSAPRDCCVWADFLTAPALPHIPAQYHGTKVLALLQCYSGSDHADGERILAPLRTVAEPILDAVAPLSYCDAQAFLDATYEHGARNYWTAKNYTALTDELIEVVTGLAGDLPSPESDILICQLGGAIDDVAVRESAYPHRGVAFTITPGTRWRDPGDDSRMVQWIRHAAQALEPGASGGAYVNFIADANGAEADAYGSNMARLREIKRVYDPDNRLRTNQNIVPG